MLIPRVRSPSKEDNISHENLAKLGYPKLYYFLKVHICDMLRHPHTHTSRYLHTFFIASILTNNFKVPIYEHPPKVTNAATCILYQSKRHGFHNVGFSSFSPLKVHGFQELRVVSVIN